MTSDGHGPVTRRPPELVPPACCAPTQLERCCLPSEKRRCCGEASTSGGTCGCQAQKGGHRG